MGNMKSMNGLACWGTVGVNKVPTVRRVGMEAASK